MSSVSSEEEGEVTMTEESGGGKVDSYESPEDTRDDKVCLRAQLCS